jgi:hypothetical protein
MRPVRTVVTLGEELAIGLQVLGSLHRDGSPVEVLQTVLEHRAVSAVVVDSRE